jgi:protein-S-isoprenylcysteine O-methyltransferase Ste14
MALIHSLENEGNWLFKRRGQIPVLLFLLAIPAVYYANYPLMLPVKAKIIGSIGIAIALLGTFIRAYTIGTTPKGTSGRNTEEQVAEVLNSTGIYSTVRHPLYLGNYLMWIGIVIFTLNLSFVIIVSLLYWIYYERIMFAEERFLEKKFGQQYLDWSLKAPAFIPALGKFIKPAVPFSIISVLRREYSGWLATVIGFVFVHVLQQYFTWHTFFIGKKWLILLTVFIVITILLRSLKHYTSLLKEDDRS